MAGSAQAQQAVEYVAAEMRKIGLEVTLEKCTVPHWVRGAETAELVEFPGQGAEYRTEDRAHNFGRQCRELQTGASAGESRGGRQFRRAHRFGQQPRPRQTVLFNVKFDKQLAAAGLAGPAYGQAVEYREKGASAAARLGAVAALIRSVGGADYRLPHTGSDVVRR